jgi:hypothetical protein
MDLQRTVGNQAIVRLYKIGTINDKIRSVDGCAYGNINIVQRTPDGNKDERPLSKIDRTLPEIYAFEQERFERPWKGKDFIATIHFFHESVKWDETAEKTIRDAVPILRVLYPPPSRIVVVGSSQGNPRLARMRAERVAKALKAALLTEFEGPRISPISIPPKEKQRDFQYSYVSRHGVVAPTRRDGKPTLLHTAEGGRARTGATLAERVEPNWGTPKWKGRKRGPLPSSKNYFIRIVRIIVYRRSTEEKDRKLWIKWALEKLTGWRYVEAIVNRRGKKFDDFERNYAVRDAALDWLLGDIDVKDKFDREAVLSTLRAYSVILKPSQLRKLVELEKKSKAHESKEKAEKRYQVKLAVEHVDKELAVHGLYEDAFLDSESASIREALWEGEWGRVDYEVEDILEDKLPKRGGFTALADVRLRGHQARQAYLSSIRTKLLKDRRDLDTVWGSHRVTVDYLLKRVNAYIRSLESNETVPLPPLPKARPK